MTQPPRRNRRRPEFRICPVCQVEFGLIAAEEQQTCSKACSQRAKHLTRAAPDAMFQEMKRRIAEKVRR